MIVSWNGDLMDEGKIQIPAFDPMLLQGMGVFETVRVIEGEVMYWEDHFERLSRSLEGLGVRESPREQEMKAQIESVLKANQLASARVRVTFGSNCLITARELAEDAKTITAVTDESHPVNERSVLTGIKSTSYAENIQLMRIHGGEVIRPNTRGELCEGCISNVFFVKDGKIHTPALETGCLPGVMRSQIIRRIEVKEGRWPFEILREVDEIWLSNAIRKIRCVTRLDDREMPAPPSEFFQQVRNVLR